MQWSIFRFNRFIVLIATRLFCMNTSGTEKRNDTITFAVFARKKRRLLFNCGGRSNCPPTIQKYMPIIEPKNLSSIISHPLDRWKNPVIQWFGQPHESTAEFYRELGLTGHNGIDFICATGTKVKAAHNGTIKIKTSSDGNNMIFLYDFENNIMTFYCHLQKFNCKHDEEVKAGEVIAFSDNTGKYTTGPHLHFGLYELTRSGNEIKNFNNGYQGAIDPMNFLAFKLKEGDVFKCPNDPMVFYLKSGKRWWLKNEQSFIEWFNVPVEKFDILKIDLITQNSYPYGGSIGK